MYANDTVIYYSNTNQSTIIKTLQDDLDNVVRWLENGRLILNQSKTKCMLFGTYQKLATQTDFNIKIGGNVIDKVQKFLYLGVTLDENPSWKDHVTTISDKVSRRLGLLSRIRSFLTLKAAKCVYNSVVNPIFSYANTAWGELSQTCFDSLQRLQNRAARIVIQRKNSKDAISILGWIDLKTHRETNKCTLVYKCLKGLVPEYLHDYFSKNSDFHSYNTRRKKDIHLPKCKLTKGQRTFKYSGSLLFNSLNDHIKESNNLSIFKQHLRNYFYNT